MSGDQAATGRRPHWRRRLIAAAVMIALLAPWWAPPALRPLTFFRVRHVEVRGWHYSSPEQVMTRLGLDSTFSIWNDLGPLAARVLADSEIRDVHITRRLPSTLVLTVVERDPVALVPSTAGFRVYDASGDRLPIDPTRAAVDLPILAQRDTALLRLLGELKAGDPRFYARISEVRRVGEEGLVLRLSHLTVRTAADVSVERLAQISSVEQDLARRHARVSELDLRFKDQIIARLQ